MTARTLRLREWESVSPRDDRGAVLRGVHLDTDQTARTAELLAKESSLVVSDLRDGLCIETTSHVGRVELGDLTVTIDPKLEPPLLLSLLRYALGLRNLRLVGSASFPIAGRLFEDLLVAQLYAEARELMSRGLRRRYLRLSEDLAVPRGRLNVLGLARRGGIIEATLPCVHHPRSEDSLLNRVLLAGLHYAAGICQDRTMRSNIRRLAGRIEDRVRRTSLSNGAIGSAKRSLNRLVAKYAPALDLIEMLYGGTRTTTEDGEGDVRLPGFLFDMNRFFQRLLERFLRQNLAGYELRSEAALTQMFRYLPDQNPKRRKPPRPRPDFVVLRDGAVAAILDAKYRDLWERSLPREMLYQLALYSVSQPPGFRSVILYPTASPGATDATVELRDPLTGGGQAFVTLRPVDLKELDDAIAKKRTSMSDKTAAALAQRFATGGSPA